MTCATCGRVPLYDEGEPQAMTLACEHHICHTCVHRVYDLLESDPQHPDLDRPWCTACGVTGDEASPHVAASAICKPCEPPERPTTGTTHDAPHTLPEGSPPPSPPPAPPLHEDGEPPGPPDAYLPPRARHTTAQLTDIARIVRNDAPWLAAADVRPSPYLCHVPRYQYITERPPEN